MTYDPYGLATTVQSAVGQRLNLFLVVLWQIDFINSGLPFIVAEMTYGGPPGEGIDRTHAKGGIARLVGIINIDARDVVCRCCVKGDGLMRELLS